MVNGPEGAGVSFFRPKDFESGFQVQSSADLEYWRPVQDDPGVEVTVESEDLQSERVTARGKKGTGQRYFRLKY